MKIGKGAVAGYYDRSQILYDLFWPKAGMHFGFWEKNTKNIKEAVENENKFVCNLLKLRKSDRVLDAGCGTGAVSAFAAKNYGCDVTGITLSNTQLNRANKMISGQRYTDKIKFLLRDYAKTNFAEKSFSKIFAIESVCHADKKIDFLKESFRLLKPGGKIAIADAFLKRTKLNREEKELYEKFLHGMTLPNIAEIKKFESDMKKAGFKKIKFHDKSESVRKSSDYIHRHASRSLPLSRLLSVLKIVPKIVYRNNVAFVVQKLLADRDVFVYGVFTAEKGL